MHPKNEPSAIKNMEIELCAERRQITFRECFCAGDRSYSLSFLDAYVRAGGFWVAEPVCERGWDHRFAIYNGVSVCYLVSEGATHGGSGGTALYGADFFVDSGASGAFAVRREDSGAFSC